MLASLSTLIVPIVAHAVSDLRILSGRVDAYACAASTPTGDCRTNASFQVSDAPLQVGSVSAPATGPDTFSLTFGLGLSQVTMVGSHDGIAALRLLGSLFVLDWPLQVPGTPGSAVVWSTSRPLDPLLQMGFFQDDANGNQVIPTPGGGGSPDLFTSSTAQMTDLVCPSSFEGECTFSLGVPGYPSLTTPIVLDVSGDPHRFVFDVALQVVPEPGTSLLVLAGLALLARRPGRAARSR